MLGWGLELVHRWGLELIHWWRRHIRTKECLRELLVWCSDRIK